MVAVDRSAINYRMHTLLVFDREVCSENNCLGLYLNSITCVDVVPILICVILIHLQVSDNEAQTRGGGIHALILFTMTDSTVVNVV